LRELIDSGDQGKTDSSHDQGVLYQILSLFVANES
jgi:hypothetical protein